MISVIFDFFGRKITSEEMFFFFRRFRKKRKKERKFFPHTPFIKKENK